MLDRAAWRGGDTPSDKKLEGDGLEDTDAASCVRGFEAFREKLKRFGWD
jgi:hypothetical protein